MSPCRRVYLNVLHIISIGEWVNSQRYIIAYNIISRWNVPSSDNIILARKTGVANSKSVRNLSARIRFALLLAKTKAYYYSL